MEFFASCPEGFESALAQELRRIGLAQVRKLKGRVGFTGDVIDAERACLWSRLSSRIFAVIARFECGDADDLYDGTFAIAWEDVLRPGATVAVTARGTTDALRNSHFSALRVKDALCDRLIQQTGKRPDVDTEHPDTRIALSLRGSRASLHLDLSGEPLFRRLPREATHAGAAHVLRPDYAALALSEAGWFDLCGQEAEDAGVPMLVDACCAGGGIVLEGAQALLDRAPGLTRAHWGFEGWAHHDPDAWAALLEEADARAEVGASPRGRIIATDVSGDATSYARRVLKAAGVARCVTFAQPDVDKILPKLGLADDAEPQRAALVADTTECPLSKLNRVLGLVSELRGTTSLGSSSVVALCRDELLERALGPANDAYTVKPNNEDATLAVWRAGQASPAEPDSRPKAPEGEGAPHAAVATVDVGDGAPVPVLVPESGQFAARLRKVARQRRKWAKREGVSCYRIYDADLPDYAASIDLYEGAGDAADHWLVISEYAAPKSIDASLAQARFMDILTLAPRVLGVDAEHVAARARTRSRGGSQYAQGGKAAAGGVREAGGGERSGKRGGGNPSQPFLIEEGGLTFEVNFDDYLDTGIFLDHRVTRGLVREHAKQARYFLNLFAYTGTATCYAADAGVEETVTVDLSNTYLDWAERNMERNGFTGHNHYFVRDDVLAWIRDQRQTRNRWDLIFCDPPTFSNSSKMGRRTWDVQRDHVDLLVGVSRLLTRDGEAIFSCNLRTFRPDTAELARAGVVLTDITAETIPEDFARNPRIHKCYLVRRYEIEEAMRLAGFTDAEIAARRAELATRQPRAREPRRQERSRS